MRAVGGRGRCNHRYLLHRAGMEGRNNRYLLPKFKGLGYTCMDRIDLELVRLLIWWRFEFFFFSFFFFFFSSLDEIVIKYCTYLPKLQSNVLFSVCSYHR